VASRVALRPGRQVDCSAAPSGRESGRTDFGFWILDFGFQVRFGRLDFGLDGPVRWKKLGQTIRWNLSVRYLQALRDFRVLRGLIWWFVK
jgi:hypothetical protein